jgi:hypothetical protein
MTKRRISKLIHVKEYVAEVDVELIYNDDDWSPYISIEDASRLDDVRDALMRKDIETASQLSRVSKLLPISA